jgi:drug/metabolite transporter (DMT)-like permease
VVEAAVVMMVLTLASGPLCLFDRVAAPATPRQWLAVAWLGVGDALNVMLFFLAYQTTTVAIAVLTHYLTPIFVALGAPLVVKERLSPRTALAVSASFVGLVLLLSPWHGDHGSRDGLGAALGAGSAVFYATNVLINKRLTGAFSGSELAFYHGLVASPLLALLAPRGSWTTTNLHALAIVAGGAVGAGALSGLFFVWGLRRIDASHASTLTLLEPLVAVTLAAVVLGEHLGAGSLVGAAFILVGSLLVVARSPLARGRAR